MLSFLSSQEVLEEWSGWIKRRRWTLMRKAGWGGHNLCLRWRMVILNLETLSLWAIMEKKLSSSGYFPRNTYSSLFEFNVGENQSVIYLFQLRIVWSGARQLQWNKSGCLISINMRATKKDGDRQLWTRWRQVLSWNLEYWIIVHRQTTFHCRCWARTRKQVVEGAWEEPEANFCSTTMKPRYDDLAKYDRGFFLWHQVKHLWWEARALVDKPKWNSNMYYLSWLTDDWMCGLMYVHHRLLTICSLLE